MKHLFTLFYLLLNSMIMIAQTQTRPGFVYAEGDKFMLDGKPYFFSGANVYDFFTYGSSSGDIETQFMDKERIDSHMRRLYVNGVRVVRLWGFSHEDWHGFEPQKGVYSEAQFSLFDYVVKSAEANGIKLIIALENYWNDYGGIKDRLQWEGISVQGAGEHDQGQFFTNESAIQGYKDYVEYFITRVNHYDGLAYKDDPTILAWELMNEPRYQGFGEDLSSETLRAWVDDMGAFIKSIDANHLLGTGLEAHGIKYGFGGDEGNDFIKIHQSPYIDFTSAHPYIRESWSNFTLDQTMKLMELWAEESHNIIKKPLYIGEFNVEIQERYEWWEEMYRFIEENKIGASGFWWFPDNQTPRDKFAVFEGDVEVAIFKEHALRMEELSGGEAIYLSLLSPKSGEKYVSGSPIHIETNLLNENNTIQKVAFYTNGTKVGEDFTAPYEFDTQNLPDGTYQITAVATATDGSTKTSKARTVTIGGEGLLTLEYKDATSATITNVIKPNFRITNRASQPVSYSDLRIRYWFETESDLPLSFYVDYAKIGSSNIKGKFVKTEGRKQYLEISFDPKAGILGSNENSGRLEPKIANSIWSDTDQSNDYSYDPTKKDFAVWDQVGLYLKGKLISGIEPNSVNVSAPIARIEASTLSGTAPLNITFDGSKSSHPNGDALTYAWDFGNGNTAVGVSANFEFIELGEQIVKLTVTDSDGNTDSTMIIVTALDPNQAPVAAFTTDKSTGIVPLTIAFDASISSDPNGDVLSYNWDFGDGQNATGVTTNHVYDKPGIFTVTLTISDGKREDQTNTTITSIDDKLVAAYTADRLSGPAPLLVNFDASESTDPRDSVLTYTWDFGDNSQASGVKTSHVFSEVGRYDVKLTVSNPEGNSATKTLTIQATAESPIQNLSVTYKDGGFGSASDNMINPHLTILNKGAEAYDYADLKLRYWFTSEENKDLNFWCDWAQLGNSNVIGSFGTQFGLDYLEISFSPSTGALRPLTNSGPIQARLAKSNWTVFNENDDYSYQPTFSDYQENDKVTLYHKGQLVWGIAPQPQILAKNNPRISIKTFPNPTTHRIEISGLNPNQDSVRLIDMGGNTVPNTKRVANQSKMSLDVKDLKAGLYLIEVNNNNKTQLTRTKILISK